MRVSVDNERVDRTCNSKQKCSVHVQILGLCFTVRGVENVYGLLTAVLSLLCSDGWRTGGSPPESPEASEVQLSRFTNGLILSFATCEILQYVITRQIVLRSI